MQPKTTKYTLANEYSLPYLSINWPNIKSILEDISSS